jgi:penicillin amidase
MVLNPSQRSAVLDVLRDVQTQEQVCAHFGIDADQYRSWEQSLLVGKLTPEDGHLTSAALHGRASIVRDRWGVPHCRGNSVADLCFAAGVAQAQDRLWQLDYRRRLASGRLAQILGAGHLPTDRENRTLGFRRIVETHELPALTEEAQEALTGFAAGMNAWIEVVTDNLPLEFEILDYEPEPWMPTDSLAILRYFWWTLTGRLTQLVAAERLLRGAPADLAAWFLTPETVSCIVPRPGDGDETWADGLHVGGSAAADDPAQTPGSNNWVAGRGRLQPGEGPVLAADPHWPLSFPDMWYEQHLTGAGIDVIGPAYPGAPPVVFGRTQGMAWGRTNNVSSTRDLYHHTVNPDDPSCYRARGEWVAFAKLHERIDVAGAESVDHEIRLTADGQPVVNDLIPPVDAEGDGPISLRWVGQECIGDVQVLLDLGRAQTVDQAIDVFGHWRLSVWNSVIADSQGHLAYQMCGSVPRRAIPTRGTRPANAVGHEWDGYWNTPDLPGQRDPDRDWVASANNPPILPGMDPPLYGTYADAYRFDRIGRFLDGTTHTAAQVSQLQADNLSLRAEDLSAAVATLIEAADSDEGKTLAGHLRSWNHCYDADQVGATIWAILWPRLVATVGNDLLPSYVAELNAANAGRMVRHLLLGTELPRPPVDLSASVARAVHSTIAYLTPILGQSIEAWTWGRAQRLRLQHPLSTHEAARRVFDPPTIPCDGGNGVINNRSAKETPRGLEVTGGPSYRFVADLSTKHATGCLLAGQSAQPGHRHYADQLDLWPKGQWHPLWMDDDVIEMERTGEFVLEPAK